MGNKGDIRKKQSDRLLHEAIVFAGDLHTQVLH